MNYVKPQKPLIQDGKGIYPLTTIDQVVRTDGRRFSENEFNRVFQRNLLRPTLQTTTINGVTCTNNGDGTFTLNGTASDTCSFKLNTIELSKGSYKVIGTPKGGNNDYSIGITGNLNEYGDGLIINLENDSSYDFYIVVMSGKTVSNIIFKPMLTEDLNATYDDFVSFDDSVITGINSGIKMDLLWENASPTSEFAPQTIDLDLSNYKFVLVRGKRTNSQDVYYTGITMINDSGFLLGPATDFLIYRNYRISNNSITFEEGRYVGTTSTNKNWAIPVTIYGIK